MTEKEIETTSKDRYFSSIGVKGPDPDLSPGAQNMSAKQHQARNKALYEAHRFLTALKKQLPLTEDGQKLKSIPQVEAWEDGARLKNDAGLPAFKDDEALLLLLADICSHVTQGLHFLASGGAPFECDMFYEGTDGVGITERIIYNTEEHKKGMMHVESMAHSLKGAGWKDCRKALLVLAGVMLVAAIPTGGVSLVAALGGVAILTAGAGFFAGRDTGLAGAVKGVKMKAVENQENVPPSENKPKSNYRETVL